MVDLGMAFVDNWVVGEEKGCYWLSDDVVELVGDFPCRNDSRSMGFSFILTLFICPNFLIRPSKMIKLASFQTRFDPFVGKDQIRKA